MAGTEADGRPNGGWSRRQFVRRGGSAAGLAGLGAVGYTGLSQLWSGVPGPAVQRFVSRPDLTPPAVRVTGAGDPSRHLFVAAAYNGPGQGGAMILDSHGDLVWFAPDSAALRKMDFGVQELGGRPVLTWWQGGIADGYGKGEAIIADTRYQQTHTVRAVGGLLADLHEFMLTPQGTALITAFRTTQADLSGVGGPARGWVLSGVAQEIDIASGNLLFEWDSLDHVPVTDSYTKFTRQSRGRPYDYFHINSIAVMPDGSLLISARNTWAVYNVTRPAGTIRWRLGGRKSSFSMGKGARFYWQHHARPHPGGVLSLFDDGAAPAEEAQSRAILLSLDTAAMRATLRRQYVHPQALLTPAMGSAQVLPDGGMFVGWGSQPQFSQFSADGTLVLDAQLPGDDPTYRAFSYPWSGQPPGRPAVAVRHAGTGNATVYASWNGATSVATWTVLAGRSPATFRPAAAGRRAGFETVITVPSRGPYYAMEARDAAGQVIGRSAAARPR
jgi:hypothetical protein